MSVSPVSRSGTILRLTVSCGLTNKYRLLEEKASITGNDYEQSLSKKKLNDNAVNRIRFLIYFDSQNKVNPQKVPRRLHHSRGDDQVK